MLNQLTRWVATGFGLGYAPFAPGLAGSLGGIGYWWLVFHFAGNAWVYGVIATLGILAGVWCAGRTAQLMKKKDPPCIVIDEIAVVPLAFAGLPNRWWIFAIAFILFRLFDVAKPTPIRQSQQLPGGLGIVIDDVLAAGFACGATHALVWITTVVNA